jgi:TonB family protein
MRRISVVTPGNFTCEISRRPCWNTFYIGLGINAAAVLLLVIVDPQLRTKVLPEPTINHYVTLVSPFEPKPVVSVPSVRIPVAPKVAKLERPQITPPPPRVEPPKPENKPEKIPEKIEVAKSQPPREVISPVAPPRPVAPPPMRQVKTNVFASEKSDLPVVHEAARKVQTGGFGDPNGLPGQGDPKRQTITATNVGSFDLPAGPGKGNGTGGSRGVSGQVHTAGFGDVSTQPVLEARNENVVASGFGDVVAQKENADPHPITSKPQIEPVEILFKPLPEYTPEARRRGVQGEVLLDVVFEASGALRINRVVKSLGYGLDDMALAAAKKIQFRPARRDGQPYDYAALVHIRFELAE